MSAEATRKGASESLVRRIALLIGGIVFVAIALVAVLAIAGNWQSASQSHARVSVVKTTLLANTLGGATRFRKADDLSPAMQGFASAIGPKVAWLAVLSPEGEVIAVHGTPDPGLDMAALVASSADGQDSPAEATLSTSPIRFGPGQDVVGILAVGWSLAPMMDALVSTSLKMAGISVVFLCAALLLVSLLLGRTVGEPLIKLEQAVRQVAGGNLDRAVPLRTRRDEVGSLATSIDKLRQDLLASQADRAEAERSREAGDSAYAEKLGQLRDTVGQMVNAARKGEFDNRADSDFEDPVLANLAEGVNQLCGVMSAFLSETGDMAAALAQGNMSVRMTSHFSGRLAEVASMLNTTAESLTGLVSGLTDTGDSLGQIVTDISRNSQDLAQRAETQSASLEQTTATMEELEASTKSNAEAVNQSAGLARQAQDHARRGRDILRDANTAMSEIEDQSTKISEIITVIDGIAFQTNLLALNAAVEAARAGEAGKGFAVVASEVRTLAQRSAQAAQDITRLIETSEQRVKVGAQLVGESGKVLELIGGSVEEVTEALSSIAQATSQQSQGISDIAHSMGKLDAMTRATAELSVEGKKQAQKVARQTDSLATQLNAFRNAPEDAADKVA